MNDDIKNQLIKDIACTGTIVSDTKELVKYMSLRPKFFRDLELTSSTLRDLMDRITKDVEPQQLNKFALASRQVRMMASDLLDACRRNMCSA